MHTSEVVALTILPSRRAVGGGTPWLVKRSSTLRVAEATTRAVGCDMLIECLVGRCKTGTIVTCKLGSLCLEVEKVWTGELFEGRYRTLTLRIFTSSHAIRARSRQAILGARLGVLVFTSEELHIKSYAEETRLGRAPYCNVSSGYGRRRQQREVLCEVITLTNNPAIADVCPGQRRQGSSAALSLFRAHDSFRQIRPDMEVTTSKARRRRLSSSNTLCPSLAET